MKLYKTIFLICIATINLNILSNNSHTNTRDKKHSLANQNSQPPPSTPCYLNPVSCF